MKFSKCFFAVLLILLLLIAGEAVALATNTGFSTETLSEEEVNTVIRNINLKPLSEEPPKNSIGCFDVNENGLIAVGCTKNEKHTVCVYTSTGEFQYGYSFESYGTFGVELDNDILNIYLVRSRVAIAINSEGTVESILEIQNTTENNSYWNKNVYATKRKVGDNTYVIKNDMGFFNLFATSFSQLAVINANGEETIIYDVNSTQLSKTAVTFFAVLIFVGIIVCLMVRQFVNIKRKREQSNGC